MSEILDCITKALADNGVLVEQTDIWTDNGLVKGVKSIIELDFSEHDKVFEDKIAELEKQIRIYQSKIKTLRTRCTEGARDNFDKEIYGCLSIVSYPKEIENENKELKQRIAELESKEAGKPTKINLNDRVKVKLTPLGAEIYYHQYDKLNEKVKWADGTELKPMMPQIDKDGYTEFQLHHFINLYGEHIGVCKPNVIEPLDIIITE